MSHHPTHRPNHPEKILQAVDVRDLYGSDTLVETGGEI